jgi:HAMP domain-containing protein
VTDLTSLSEERLRDAARFREQAQQLRQAMDDMNKDSLGRIEELRREVEARDSQHKVGHSTHMIKHTSSQQLAMLDTHLRVVAVVTWCVCVSVCTRRPWGRPWRRPRRQMPRRRA